MLKTHNTRRLDARACFARRNNPLALRQQTRGQKTVTFDLATPGKTCHSHDIATKGPNMLQTLIAELQAHLDAINAPFANRITDLWE